MATPLLSPIAVVLSRYLAGNTHFAARSLCAFERPHLRASSAEEMAGEDNEGGRRDDERWMRLLGWLAAEHNMDISKAGLLVENRTVPGA